MTQPASAADPSVDEILSSIREIVAEDEGAVAAADEGAADDDEDILELTEADEAPADTDTADLVEVEVDIDEELVEQEKIAAFDDAPAPEPTSDAEDADRGPGDVLLKGATAAATSDALHRLSVAMAPGDAVPAGERSIEAFLTDMLRPELKVWLDQHLAPLVERIVEREIKRLVRDADPA